MNTFEITVQRKTGSIWPIVAVQSSAGLSLPVRSEGVLQVDLAKLKTQSTPDDYGALLGKALFCDSVRDAFVQALGKSDDRLHVLLFVEDAELRVLRWEQLCAPLDGDWQLLALHQRVPFSLYLPSVTDRRFPPIGRRDLRALIVVANPEGLNKYRLEPFDGTATASSVRAALGEIPSDVLAVVDGVSTLDALCERITAEQYTLLHIVGHGHFTRDNGETILFLAGADKQVEPVEATRLLSRLKQVRGARGLPHFTFLSTCESAAPEAEGSLGGLAQRLVRDLGMPAVVAMTEKVSIATAHDLAASFYRQLRVHGEVDRALVEACAGHAERHDAIVPALYSRLGGRPLFSDTLDRPLTNAEIGDGLTRMRPMLDKRAPVLLAEFDKLNESLRGTLKADDTALSSSARAEREAALKALGSMCDEALDLAFAAFALGKEPPGYNGDCPFLGLYPFRPEDRRYFFGREELIKKLKRRIDEANFLAVLGPSGSGKSSVVFAGLLPLLSEDPGFQFVSMTPGAEPLQTLDALLAKATPSLLVVDQFEETFTLCVKEETRSQFIDRLLELTGVPPPGAPPGRFRVIITMRADFYGECASYRGLTDQLLVRQQLIGPMDAVELRRAMEQQANAVGLRFEANVAHTILTEVQGEPGAMPLLQHGLLQLWRNRHGKWLRASEYERMGGIKQAIAKTADAEYTKFSEADQKRVRDIFMRLTRLDSDALKPEDRRDTRQRVTFSELVPEGHDPAPIRNLIEKLADARLIVTSENEVTREKEVEVGHEALIRSWPRLRTWLDEDRTALQLRKGIREAADIWQKDNTAIGHRGARLLEAERLSQREGFFNNDENKYLKACVAERERDAQEKATHQRQLDEERQTRTIQVAARELVAHAIDELSADPELSLILALEAMRTSPTAKAEEVLREAINASNVRATFDKHSGNVNTVAFSPDGTHLLTAGNDGGVWIWNLRTREGVQVENRPHWMSSAAFSADGRFILTAGPVELRLLHLQENRWQLASAFKLPFEAAQIAAMSRDGQYIVAKSSSNSVAVWRTDQPESPPFLTQNVFGAALSPDSRFLALANHDHSAKVVETATGKEVAVDLRGHKRQLISVAFSPDGKLLVTTSWDNTACVYEWQRPKNRRVSQLTGHTEGVLAAAFSLDSKLVATAGAYLDNTARLWDPWTGTLLKVFASHGSGVIQLAFRGSGMLATASADNTARLWNVATGDEVACLQGHTGQVRDVAFSPNGSFVATAGWDSKARVWEVPGGVVEFNRHERDVLTAEFSPDGNQVLTAGADGSARIWDVRTGQSLCEPISYPDSYVNSAAFSRDGNCIVVGIDGRARRTNAAFIWRREGDAWRLHRELKGTPKDPQVRDVEFSPDGANVLTTSGCSAFLWNAIADEPPRELTRQSRELNTASFSPDGEWVAVSCWDGNAYVVPARGTSEPAAGVPLKGHKGAVYSAFFSPDGTLVATASGDTIARVFNWRQGEKPIMEFRGHRKRVYSAKFSPDGQFLLTASEDETARIWDVKSGRVVTEIRGHTRALNYASFSPDGRRILTASSDRSARIFEPVLTKTEDLLELAASRVTRKLSDEERDKFLPAGTAPSG